MENNIILYTDENGKTDISVCFAEEDVWVTQKQLENLKSDFDLFMEDVKKLEN